MPTANKTNHYVEGVGRRKTAVARVRLISNPKASLVINGRSLQEYFSSATLVGLIEEALTVTKAGKATAISIKVSGGGLSAQAIAVRQGLARALAARDNDLRPVLKKAKFLVRDSRMKERRKFGLKKARKAPQWSKR